MKRKHLNRTLLALGAVTSAACATTGQAQSSDGLLNKLIEKGIITKDEAKAFKAESDGGFTKAYQTKSGMPDWVTSFKINGDFRGRAEGFVFENDSFADRLRFRYRLRLGATAVIKDNLEVGLRLTSSDAAGGSTYGDPISGNTTLQDNGAKKFVFVDLAYGKWTPLNQNGLTGSVTIGKMENPFVLSDSVFDHDYTPEGIATSFSYNVNKAHSLKLNLGGFILDELSTDANDPYLLGAQVRWDGKWSDKVSSSLGVAALSINNPGSLINTAVPNVNAGNSRTGTGALQYSYNPVIADASATYTFASAPLYKGSFPIKVYGEFMNNPAAPHQNSSFMGGLTFGKAGKKGTWALDYRYKYLERDAWYEELTDSDFGSLYPAVLPNSNSTGATRTPGYAAGTGSKGHVLSASYSPYDALTLQFKYWRTELIQDTGPASSVTHRFQVDANWKF
jgi:hypothetical protein